MDRHLARFLGKMALACLLLSACACARAAVPESAVRTAQIEEKRAYVATVSRLRGDIVYKRAGDMELTLDLMLPLKTVGKDGKAMYPEGAPLVLFLHGGGWRGGSRYFSGADVKFFSDRGIAIASPSYRLVRDGNANTVETCVIDCFDAARYLVGHAREYGLDPSRLFVYGGSAGGHLALMLAWADPGAFKGEESLAGAKVRFSGALAIAPVGTLADEQARDPIDYLNEPGRMEKLLGGPFPQKKALAEKLSPLYWLTKDSPRTLVIHGEKDERVSIKGSLMLEQRARELGADFTLLRAPGAGHNQRGERAPLWRVQGLIILDNLLDMVQSTYGPTNWSQQPWRSAGN